MEKNITFLSIIIAIIIFIRCIFDNNDKIVYIVACINIVAFLFVFFIIIQKVISSLTKKIKETNIPKQIMEREINRMKKMIRIISSFSACIGTLLYFLFACSGVGNDIISILALGISIMDAEIV